MHASKVMEMVDVLVEELGISRAEAYNILQVQILNALVMKDGR